MGVLPQKWTEEGLEEWLRQPEVGWELSCEFKSNLSDTGADGVRKAFAAFANSEGGYVVFGISDDPRELVGDRTGNEFLTKLQQWISEIKPPLLDSSWRPLDEVVNLKIGGQVIFVQIDPSPPFRRPHLTSQKIYRRDRGRSEPINSGSEVRQIMGNTHCYLWSTDGIKLILNSYLEKLVSGLELSDKLFLREFEQVLKLEAQKYSQLSPAAIAFSRFTKSIFISDTERQRNLLSPEFDITALLEESEKLMSEFLRELVLARGELL